MAKGMPQILINFTQKAVSAISRSEKGTVCIIVKDSTKNFSVKEYNYSTDVEEEDYTEENYKAIKRVFLGTPNKVFVARIGTDENFSTAVKLIEKIKYNWVCILDNTTSVQQELATYIKTKNSKDCMRKVKAVVFKATTTDDMHIVNFTTETVTENGEEVKGGMYIGRIAGVLAGLPFTRSATNYLFDDLTDVSETEDEDEAVSKGEFFLVNREGEIFASRAVNSLKTIDSTHTEDMQKITIVEAMDTILEDIAAEFQKNYIGKYKNTYDNQAMFMSAINSYFRSLEKEDILDKEYDNTAEVDIEAQREAWISTGKTEAADWDENKVKKMTYRSYVYLSAKVKILDAVEDLIFNINMA